MLKEYIKQGDIMTVQEKITELEANTQKIIEQSQKMIEQSKELLNAMQKL